jgi:tetratricopeptide (TPR) repeat protein
MRYIFWLAAAGLPLAAQVMTTPTTSSGGQTRVQESPSLYLSGKIALEDGAAIPPNVTVERVCGGVSKTVAYTDARGHFNFRWSGNGGAIVDDASDAGSGAPHSSNAHGYGSSQSAGGGNILASDPFASRMMNCALRASLAGYRSDAIDIFNHRASDDPDIGTIVLHRIAGVEGASISVTSMQAPKAARAAFERGLQAQLKNRPADAVSDFEKAVALYPKFADAWVNLAKLRLAAGADAPAREALVKAMDADPKLVAPYLELGLAAAKESKWDECLHYLDHALELDPVDYPLVWYTDAVANYNLAKYDAAEKSARTAAKLDPHHVNPRAEYLLGLVLAEKKDYAGAATELAAFIKLAPNAPDLPQVKDRLSEIEKLAAQK